MAGVNSSRRWWRMLTKAWRGDHPKPSFRPPRCSAKLSWFSGHIGPIFMANIGRCKVASHTCSSVFLPCCAHRLRDLGAAGLTRSRRLGSQRNATMQEMLQPTVEHERHARRDGLRTRVRKTSDPCNQLLATRTGGTASAGEEYLENELAGFAPGH